MSAPMPPPPQPDRPEPGPAGPGEAPPTNPGWFVRRRDKIAAEVARNRQGGHRVPTWVLAAALLLIVGAWATLILLA
jgi:hypothetical protein